MKIRLLLALLLIGTALNAQVKQMRIVYSTGEEGVRYNFTYNKDGALSQLKKQVPGSGAVTIQFEYDEKHNQLVTRALEGPAPESVSLLLPTYSLFSNHKAFSCTVGRNVMSLEKGEDLITLGSYTGLRYQDGYLQDCYFEDFMTNGVCSFELAWKDGLLTGLKGFGPGDESFDVKDMRYDASPNPFSPVDPLAYMILNEVDLFWQGLAGERPSKQLKSYQLRVNEWGEVNPNDPWIQVRFEYVKDAEGRITQVKELRDDALFRTMIIAW